MSCHALNMCCFLNCNRRHSFLAQLGTTALLAAAFGGSVDVVKMLLMEFNSSLDEVNDVSV